MATIKVNDNTVNFDVVKTVKATLNGTADVMKALYVAFGRNNPIMWVVNKIY